MFTYKNVSELDQDLVGFGEVKAGDVIETDREIHNPNFVLQNTAETPTSTEIPVTVPEEPTPPPDNETNVEEVIQ